MSTFSGPMSATVPEWREKLKTGKAMALGCALNSSSTLCAELAAAQGYDFCLVDAQHSAVDPEKLRCMLQAVHAGGAKAMVRVGGADDRIGIQQSFDLGADAILVPCSRTADDIRKAISCAKYPVAGPGSEGGSRSVYVNLRPQLPGGFGALFDYVQTTGNQRTFVACQIETKDALENIEEICAVPGLDCAFIGPGDLAVDMGLATKYGMPGCWASEEFKAAEKKIAEACAKNNVIAGYWNSSLEEKSKLGFRLFVVGGDVASMQAALAENIKTMRDTQTELGFGN